MSEDLAVLVVEDDPIQARLFSVWLHELPGVTIHIVDSGPAALQALEQRRCAIAIVDVHLPGMSGLELLKQLRERHPETAVIIVTARPDLDATITAIRGNASDFLVKPVEPQSMIDAIQRALASRPKPPQLPKRTILAVGAHPDDVEIGCGGTLLGHAAQGDNIVILTLTPGARGGDVPARLAEAQRAAQLLSAKLIMGDLVDAEVSEGFETIQVIAAVVREHNPDVMYTHSAQDAHQDHRNTHAASMIAGRTVPAIHAYQAPSTTIAFQPSRYVDISKHLDHKIDVLAVYGSQKHRTYLEPEFVRSTARYWGRFNGYCIVEPFEVIRAQ